MCRRFFFLSNDELLEILSETKDSRKVQPYLKKCFEGIHDLVYDAQDCIVAMVSTEREVVRFKGQIRPSDAKVSALLEYYILSCATCTWLFYFSYTLLS